MAPLLGISLHHDPDFIDRNRELVERAEVWEINPEALWDRTGARDPRRAWFADLLREAGRPLIGHGVRNGVGAAVPPPRRDGWLAAQRRDQQDLALLWFSEHLGFIDCGESHLGVPLPLAPCEASIATVVGNLRPLQDIYPLVAFENNVGYCGVGHPFEEVGMFGAICARSGCRMLLDLHNAYTVCVNHGLDPLDYLARLDLDHVIEIHLSGGSESEPQWVPSRRVLRLDSHDHRVPEPVWEMFGWALPRCRDLRAVIVEWVPDAFDDARLVAAYAADVERARGML